MSFIAIFLSACSSKKPMDYYNMAVSAGNTSLTFYGLEYRLERLESGMAVGQENLAQNMSTRLPYNEKLLEDLKELLGNEEAAPMISSAISYLEFDIACAKDTRTSEIMEVVGQASTFEEATNKLQPFETYLDSIYDRRDALYSQYDYEVTQFAKKNDIEMIIIGE